MKKNQKIKNKNISIRTAMISILVFVILIIVFIAWECIKDNSEFRMQIPEAQEKNTNIVTAEPIERWIEYKDKKYNFEFKHPEMLEVKPDDSRTEADYYLIYNKESSEQIANFFVKKWKGYVVKENTPGTFWEKLSKSNWQYFTGSIKSISSGECSNEMLSHIFGQNISKAPRSCIIDVNNNLIKIETENNIIYYTKDLEIRWDIEKNNTDLVKKIIATFNI